MTVMPQCFACKHLRKGRTPAGSLLCAAYPADPGIPDAILTNQADHRKPYFGDNGVRFEAKDER